MKYAIVFSSRTGNTAQLADVVKENLPKEECLYFGPPGEEALEAPVIFMGFWTDKGTCDEAAKDFLQRLKEKRVFLFGTAGFGGGGEYFDKILCAAKKNLDDSNTVTGEFMCQGKMPSSVLKRYEKMLLEGADAARMNGMIENFHKASLHPDQLDLDNLRSAILNLMSDNMTF